MRLLKGTFMKFELTKVEQSFLNKKNIGRQSTKIPYLIVDNFPDLGLLTALRFLEWSLENPKGVVSLPTGKTPEYFIKSSHYILNKWGTDDVNNICNLLKYFIENDSVTGQIVSVDSGQSLGWKTPDIIKGKE